MRRIAKFEDLAHCSDAELNLAEAALLIARDEYPDLDIELYLRRLDGMADEVRARAQDSLDPLSLIVAMNEYLFVDQSFSGNIDDYSDPRNSYLNDVLERRLGIPFSLSVLYMELGGRVGVAFEGVSFPGHFLVKCAYEAGQIVIDPFFNGVSLGEEELLNRVSGIAASAEDPRQLLAHLLGAASKRDILTRMLRNLRVIFLQTGRPERALETANKICVLGPDDASELRQRAELLEKLECFKPALGDYTRYLELLPMAADAAHVREKIMDLRTQVARIS